MAAMPTMVAIARSFMFQIPWWLLPVILLAVGMVGVVLWALLHRDNASRK